MSRAAQSLVFMLCLSAYAWAVPAPNTAPTTPVTAPAAPTTPSANAAVATNPTAGRTAAQASNPLMPKPLTYEQLQRIKAEQELKLKNLAKQQELRLKQLEKANLDALSQNQELQLKNDNLFVQLQVLQSERSAQMFLYGAATLGCGVLFGFLIASYIYTKRRRQW